MLTLQSLLWLCVAAYALHVLEEYVFDWQSWARSVLRLPAQWNDFYVTNAAVIVVGIAAAELAPTLPAAAMAYPALMLINAVFFHIAPVLLSRGRFSPGLITALSLFLPLGIASIYVGGLSSIHLALAFALGAVLMATPIAFLKLKSKPYFDQDRGAS